MSEQGEFEHITDFVNEVDGNLVEGIPDAELNITFFPNNGEARFYCKEYNCLIKKALYTATRKGRGGRVHRTSFQGKFSLEC